MTKSDALLDAAREAAVHAYAPYSRFAVGAALRTRSGRIFSGCNVECASYGLTSCAERNAIAQAIAAGERDIEEVLIYTPTAEPTAPCGACRQVINEFGPQARVRSVCDSTLVLDLPLPVLLPLSFGPCNLGSAESA
jgi:cytidine deaminase